MRYGGCSREPVEEVQVEELSADGRIDSRDLERGVGRIKPWERLEDSKPWLRRRFVGVGTAGRVVVV